MRVEDSSGVRKVFDKFLLGDDTEMTEGFSKENIYFIPVRWPEQTR
jgi:hypothetical protein